MLYALVPVRSPLRTGAGDEFRPGGDDGAEQPDGRRVLPGAEGLRRGAAGVVPRPRDLRRPQCHRGGRCHGAAGLGRMGR